jgi:hypothetical protein
VELLNSQDWCTVHYPACIFATEKHGVFPFERFAYDALRVAPEAFSAVSLPAVVAVSFDRDGTRAPWLLNAWVREDKLTGGFAIEATPFTPPVLLAICHRIARPLFDADGRFDEWHTTPNSLNKELVAIGNLINSAAATAREQGLGPALLQLRDGGQYTFATLPHTTLYFDSAVQALVNHEAAHAYMRHLERIKTPVSDLDRKAFEFMADLTATSWMYRKFIVNTPNTDEYREMRGFSTHDEALRANARTVLEAQLTLLALAGITDLLRTKGPATFEGGRSHPHSMVRYQMQQLHFLTLILSNFSEAFAQKHVDELDDWWLNVLLLLTRAGLLPPVAEAVFTDDAHFAAVRRAGELAEELQVAELIKAAPFLRTLTTMDRRKR